MGFTTLSSIGLSGSERTSKLPAPQPFSTAAVAPASGSPWTNGVAARIAPEFMRALGTPSKRGCPIGKAAGPALSWNVVGVTLTWHSAQVSPALVMLPAPSNCARTPITALACSSALVVAGLASAASLAARSAPVITATMPAGTLLMSTCTPRFTAATGLMPLSSVCRPSTPPKKASLPNVSSLNTACPSATSAPLLRCRVRKATR